MKERWREVFDGFYEVSNLGNVRRAKPGISTFVGRPVRPMISAGGYAQVQLASPTDHRRAYIHHLIAEAFIGPRPKGHVVNHIDGNKANNAAKNLEYVTARENCRHALRAGRRHRGPSMPRRPLKGPQTGSAHWTHRMPDRIARGERMGTSRLKTRDVKAIRRWRKNGYTMQAIADAFGVCLAQISRILRGQRWAHVK